MRGTFLKLTVRPTLTTLPPTWWFVSKPEPFTKSREPPKMLPSAGDTEETNMGMMCVAVGFAPRAFGARTQSSASMKRHRRGEALAAGPPWER